MRSWARRLAGRGRPLAAVAAALLLVAALLPWFTFAGDLPDEPLRAFDGSGVLAVIAALATLALLSLPLTGVRPEIDPDRPASYVLLAGIAVLGVALWPLGFVDDPAGLLPQRAPGWWLAIVGSVVFAAAAVDIARNPQRPFR